MEQLYHSCKKMPEVTLTGDEVGTGTNEGIQQYYILKIEELQVRDKLCTDEFLLHTHLFLACVVREAAECSSP